MMMPSALYGPTFTPSMYTFIRTTRATPLLCSATSLSALRRCRVEPSAVEMEAVSDCSASIT